MTESLSCWEYGSPAHFIVVGVAALLFALIIGWLDRK